MAEKISVALIGAGSMGGALLKGWLGAGVVDPGRSAVFEPNPGNVVKALARQHAFSLNPNNESRQFDVVAIAIKPQAAADALPEYRELAKPALALSIMAGASVASIAEALGGHQRIIRAMPNLPAAVSKGASGLFAASAATKDDCAKAEALMRAVGAAVWVDEERLIDAVTAVSGSGPAYFFLLADALSEAAVEAGLSREAAIILARATLEGAGAFAAADARSAGELAKAVTSPGGTTAAALSALDGDDRALRKLVKEAVKRAYARGREMAGK
ncbi:MAG: pyrroline-5-carboxylate reductase [Parvularculaceae bacterium]